MTARAWRGRRNGAYRAQAKLAKKIIRDAKRAIRAGERDLSNCAYYRGAGTCSGSTSCYYLGEPVCQTDEPEFGWPSMQLRTAHRLAGLIVGAS